MRVVESKGILLLVSQESQLSLSSSLDALEGQRDRHVSALGGVVRSTLPDEGSLVLVLSGDVEQGVEVGRGGEGVCHWVAGEERPDVPAGGAGGHG